MAIYLYEYSTQILLPSYLTCTFSSCGKLWVYWRLSKGVSYPNAKYFYYLLHSLNI